MNWKLSLIVGLLSGSALGVAGYHYYLQPQQQAYATLQNDYRALSDLHAKDRMDNQKSMRAQQHALTTAQQTITTLTQQLEEQQHQHQALKKTLETLQKAHKKNQQAVVKQKKLNKEVAVLKVKTQQQQVVIDNSALYFEQKEKIEHELAAAKRITLACQEKEKKMKQACEEFKSGDSWNWVSEKDCDSYQQQHTKVLDAQAIEAELQKALVAINQKMQQ